MFPWFVLTHRTWPKRPAIAGDIVCRQSQSLNALRPVVVTFPLRSDVPGSAGFPAVEQGPLSASQATGSGLRRASITGDAARWWERLSEGRLMSTLSDLRITEGGGEGEDGRIGGRGRVWWVSLAAPRVWTKVTQTHCLQCRELGYLNLFETWC